MQDRLNDLALLNLGQDATQEQITAAYHERAKKVHPDKNNQETRTEFQTLHDAYKRLRIQPMADAAHTEKTEWRFFKSLDEARDYIGDFSDTFKQLLRRNEQKELQQHVITNKEKLQDAIRITESIDPLISIFIDTKCYEELKLLDGTWLRELPALNNSSHLARFLRAMETEWQNALDTCLGHGWLREFCLKSDNFIQLLYSSSPRDPYNHDRLNITSLLQYLGQDWLRRIWYRSASYLASAISIKGRFMDSCVQEFLSFLNGDDNWLKSEINDGESIGIILKAIRDPSYETRNYLTRDTRPWSIFLSYVDLPKAISDPVQLNALLTQLVSIPYQTAEKDLKYDLSSIDNIIYFLTNYWPEQEKLPPGYRLDKEKSAAQITILISLLSALPSETAFNPHAHAIVKNIAIIHFFKYNDIDTILSNPVPQTQWVFSADLQYTWDVLKVHKNQPCYRALLLAAAKVYYCKLLTNPENSRSTFGYTTENKLAAAESLIHSILHNTDFDTTTHPSGKWGDLGKISKLYGIERHPGSDAGIAESLKYFLLGNSESKSQPEHQEPILQLTYIEPSKTGMKNS